VSVYVCLFCGVVTEAFAGQSIWGRAGCIPCVMANLTTTQTPAPPYTGVTDIARNLGISRQGVRNLIARKELPAVRVGKLFRVSTADFAAYLAARTTT
jgi:excisionase family DNA binding protein